jgi:hypothetical protein
MIGAPGEPIYMQACLPEVDALNSFTYEALVARPGTAILYSSYGYTLAVAALTAAAGAAFLNWSGHMSLSRSVCGVSCRMSRGPTFPDAPASI